jgi:hypothetical protein
MISVSIVRRGESILGLWYKADTVIHCVYVRCIRCSRCILEEIHGVSLRCTLSDEFSGSLADTLAALILAYGASTATTLVPTLNALLTDTSTPPLSTMELANLLGSYIPFLLFPLGMALDMGVKLIKLVQVAEGRKRV